MNPDSSTPRARLLPSGVEPVQLYRTDRQIDDDAERCRLSGWKVIDLNASAWADPEILHDDLATALAFPPYYGRNLDALADLMMELPQAGWGFSHSTGGLLVLRRFDGFITGDRGQAEAVLEILASATNRALQFGWPFAVALQSDDPNLVLPPVAPMVIAWNRQERRI